MKSCTTDSGKKSRKIGAFQKKKAKYKSRQEIYNKINKVTKTLWAEAERTGKPAKGTIILDRHTFSVSTEPPLYYYHYNCFIAVRGMGYLLANVCEKDAGYIESVDQKIGYHIRGIHQLLFQKNQKHKIIYVLEQEQSVLDKLKTIMETKL